MVYNDDGAAHIQVLKMLWIHFIS